MDRPPLRLRLFLRNRHLSPHKPHRRLFNLTDYKPSPLTKPHKNLKSSDVVVVANPSCNLRFRLYIPTAATTKLPIIVFFHGGGFVFMSATSKPYDDFCQLLTWVPPAVVISFNYNLALEHQYPCQYDDSLDILKFIEDSSLFEGANLGQCFLVGDCASENIAHHVAIRASGHEFWELNVGD
ncbi:putative carboxylesterase [Rosa chinensis]|uniref:Putative carboxylesterase n=1 Tax=Rosa chinensis TaxID=74649 RepID=A0A2P6PKG0_ROSCH|nr:probable carboxylesterase 18 [Rosa chinensis]PRQ22415.1 putative carboxylesterase [Rosa chinensis]